MRSHADEVKLVDPLITTRVAGLLLCNQFLGEQIAGLKHLKPSYNIACWF
jgi:hypothetical protein